ncbi:IS110 family transposase [Acidiferrobacter thiooxydans]|uniref:IS110 family transposase n=1 Tax=Acidiferrobacter thiooxydans TaxID=163359 RepID=UPI003B97031B
MTRIGLDIAKQVLQVHGVDEHGVVRIRKTLARAQVLEFFAQLPPCTVGMEACAGAHYWGRELTRLGHTVKLMAAQFVTPYRKRGKNDANDAEAICEAVGRPNMPFVAIKTEEQQAVLMVHRARSLVVANRTAQVNQIRGLLGEFGLTVPQGVASLRTHLPRLLEDAENGLPMLAHEVLAGLLTQLHTLDQDIAQYDAKIRALAQASEPARRLMQVAAIGPQTATALVASMGDPHVFQSGRNYAASLGLIPRQHSSGGKNRLGAITKQGDRYLQTLLIHGARAFGQPFTKNPLWWRNSYGRPGRAAPTTRGGRYAVFAGAHLWGFSKNPSGVRSPYPLRRLSKGPSSDQMGRWVRFMAGALCGGNGANSRDRERW